MSETPANAPPPAVSFRLELVAGWALMVLVGIGLFLGGLDVIKRKDELKPLLAGDAAPGFSLRPPEGGAQISLESLRGKVVLIDFWATWCPPCLRELPELAALHAELKDRGFTVLAVNREPEDLGRVREFVKDKQLLFPVVVDDNNVGERYRILSLPLSVLVDRDGRVVQLFMGYTGPSVMREAVLKALGS